MTARDQDRDRLFAVIESAPDALVAVDASGAIILVNSEAEAMFGYPRDELVGQPVDQLLPERFRAAHAFHRAAYAESPRRRPMGEGYDLVARRKNGDEFPVDISLSPLSSSGDVIAAVRDITDRRRVEARLAYLAAIVESSDDAIWSYDHDGNITSWNLSAERLCGYTAREVLGTQPTRLVPAHRVEEWQRILEFSLAGERVEHLETEIQRKLGLVVPISLTISPIRSAAGRILGASAIARDLTEQILSLATLADSEARLRESEALAHVGGWTWDIQTGTVQWSDEMHRIHAVDPHTFGGILDDHLERIHADDRASVRDAFDALRSGSVHEFAREYRIVRDGGETRWLYSRGRSVADVGGKPTGVRGICQDITDRHQAEQATRDLLERERQAAEDLRAADRIKDEFLAIVSHELRTPLTVIIGFASLLPTRPIDEHPMLIETIARNGAEMHRMIERLLDFTRLQAGRVDVRPEPLVLAEAAGDCVKEVSELMGDHPIEVDIPDDIVVAGDRDGFARILGNLLTNAAKYATPGSTVNIVARKQDSEAIVTVANEGAGMTAETAARVFERFFQGPDQPPGRRGAGVGLAIVQRYVELLGGRVWCESTPGERTRFSVALPLSTEATVGS